MRVLAATKLWIVVFAAGVAGCGGNTAGGTRGTDGGASPSDAAADGSQPWQPVDAASDAILDSPFDANPATDFSVDSPDDEASPGMASSADATEGPVDAAGDGYVDPSSLPKCFPSLAQGTSCTKLGNICADPLGQDPNYFQICMCVAGSSAPKWTCVNHYNQPGG